MITFCYQQLKLGTNEISTFIKIATHAEIKLLQDGYIVLFKCDLPLSDKQNNYPALILCSAIKTDKPLDFTSIDSALKVLNTIGLWDEAIAIHD